MDANHRGPSDPERTRGTGTTEAHGRRAVAGDSPVLEGADHHNLLGPADPVDQGGIPSSLAEGVLLVEHRTGSATAAGGQEGILGWGDSPEERNHPVEAVVEDDHSGSGEGEEESHNLGAEAGSLVDNRMAGMDPL